MSSSSEIVDSGRCSVQTPAKPPEKWTFSQTCSRLSQYLKEKGSLGDLNLGMSTTGSSNPSVTTMNLFPVVDKSGQNDTAPAQAISSVNFCSQQNGFASSFVKQECPKKPESAQMTIFYAGQVIVFDNFPAEKAKEIMLLAGKGISQIPNTFSSASIQKPSDPSNLVAANPISQRSSQPVVVSDLPIARKASLARFLEKRKDRITSRAPYQTGNSSAGAASKPAESKLWLGLSAQSPLQFEAQLL